MTATATFALHRHLAETQKNERLLHAALVKSVKRGPQQGHKSLLCLTINNLSDNVTLQKLKMQQHNESFVTRQRWPLADLKHVDAIGGPDVPNPANRQFVLTFTGEKPTRWQVFNIKDKESFLFVLWRSCGRYLRVSPKFENFDTHSFTGEAATAEQDDVYRGGEEGRGSTSHSPSASLTLGIDGENDEDVITDDKELTAQQEQDIDEVLAHRDWSQNDAEEYSTRLAESLAGLETENILAVLSADRKANMLIKDIDHALRALDTVEEQVNRFVEIIFDVRTDVTDVEEQVKVVDAQALNEKALIAELEGVVGHIDFPDEYRQALLTGDLSNALVLGACVDAVDLLQKKRAALLSPGLDEMAAVKLAVKEQKGLEDHFAMRFEQFLYSHLHDQMKQMGVSINHVTRRRRLEPYAPLMRWLKKSEPLSRISRHSTLCKSYADELCPEYLKDLRESCELCKAACGVKAKGGTAKRDLQSRVQFDVAFEQLLDDVVPTRVAEQEFCSKFFMDADVSLEAPMSSANKSKSMIGRAHTTSGASRELEALVETFQGFDDELLDCIAAIEKLDPFFSVIAMARLQMIVPIPGTMLYPYMRNIRSVIMDKFNAFVDNWTKSVRAAKAPTKKKIGILPLTERFASTIEHMEKIMERTDGAARMRVEPAMLEMAEAVSETIERIAAEVKYRQVVIFENCHILKDRLSHLKIECLKQFREDVTAKYRTALHVFVQSIPSRPMEKLSIFFEKIERLIDAGTAPHEVGFKMAFSKAELRKVIALYPGKEVRKGLNEMYKRVDRHLSDDAYLMDVVWRNLQEEMVKQYNRFDELIALCYPGEKVSLEFDVNDMLSYFVSIAQST
mmetsp:Transcript_22679/g.68296  ORF Transcript_22679/g.68296 Transcript_22679/m.68296 type:complete len:850 (+) Transcript_22679:54-2603(+)